MTARGWISNLAAWSLLWLAGCGFSDSKQATTLITGDESLERVSEKGPVKLVVRVTPREPRLSDLVQMEVLVTAPPKVEIKPPAFGQAVGDFLVRDYSERTNAQGLQSGNEPQTRRFVYQLEPAHAGRHLIRALAIEFVDNRPDSEQRGDTVVIESEPLEVNITSELGDQVPDLANLEPMMPPRPLSSSSRWSWSFLAAAIGILGLLVFWWRRRKKTRVLEPPRQTPQEIAHAAFAQLLSENLPAKGLFKEFYLRLTDIVRQFIEGTTGLQAPEQTTEEFLQAMRLRNVFSIERSERLQEFLEAADMVKYAGQQPDHDQIELSIARAREFVDFRSPADVATKNSGHPTLHAAPVREENFSR